MKDRLSRMKELVFRLREADRAYYAENREIMSNREYDSLYDELTCLEKETGTILSGSPTITVGYEAVDELPKESHETAMLSLDKTKDREELAEWLKEREGILSWKLDGLTIVLTYEEGRLRKAVTRGSGEVGEVITPNAEVFVNLPLVIPFSGKLILRGEAVISYSDFEKINEELEPGEEKYKNPRNLCSGSVRQLNNAITAARRVRFFAFSLVSAGEDNKEKDFENSREKELLFLEDQGFEVVEYKRVEAKNIGGAIEEFEQKAVHYDLPSDGLVLTYEDIAYGESLGKTSKFPRNAIAFKWADEEKETTLLDMEWSPSRTGLINPVAIFEPVELEGTTVSRASVHNISIVRQLKLGIGDRITVYKANMIIPQIAENLSCSGTLKIPSHCPACRKETTLKEDNEVQLLYCMNPDCGAKKIKSFTHFVSRDALNIDGLSEATLEKFIAEGYLSDFTDIFHLDRYKEEIEKLEGFGTKSCSNLLKSVEKARKTTLSKFIYALGIANIGPSNARMICREFDNDLDKMMEAGEEELGQIDGIGGVIAGSFCSYFREEKNLRVVNELRKELEIEVEKEGKEGRTLAGKSFAITGTLLQFENRNALKEKIQQLGGKVVASVSSKTTALINNDAASASSKNKKAREAGVEVLTEAEFVDRYLRDL